MFKFEIGEKVEVYRIVNTGLHGDRQKKELEINIGSISQILDCHHSNFNGEIYLLNAICPGGVICPWWFAECELRLEKEISSFTKSIINKVFTGRNYD